jgi:hypothetical protein
VYVPKKGDSAAVPRRAGAEGPGLAAERLRVVGDSIVNATIRSGWVAKLQEAYPKARGQRRIQSKKPSVSSSPSCSACAALVEGRRVSFARGAADESEGDAVLEQVRGLLLDEGEV